MRLWVKALGLLLCLSSSALAEDDKVLNICLTGGTPEIKREACLAVLGEPDVPPERAEMAQFALGEALLDLDDLPASYESFQAALKLDPQSADTHRMVGLIHLLNKSHAAAITALGRATSLNPRDAEAWNLWGVAHATIGDNKTALSGYYKALQIDPEYIVPITNRAQLFITMGQFRRAISEIRRAMKHTPGDPELLRLMGVAQQGAGQS